MCRDLTPVGQSESTPCRWNPGKGESRQCRFSYVSAVNATAAARTYRIGGLQPYVMALVLAACAAFSPFVLGHAISSRSWLELGWVGVVVWFWCTTVWSAAYRIDVANDTVEFRFILWRRRVSLSKIRWIRSAGPGFAVVHFEGGTVQLYGAVDDWHDFVSQVRRANPALRLFRLRQRRRRR